MTDRIRNRREELKLAQVELAQLAGISRQALGAIETGRAVPSVDVALRIATALGVRVEDLFGEPATWTVRAPSTDEPGSTRRIVAKVGQRWVTHSLGEREHEVAADGIVDGRGQVRLFRPPAVTGENVVVMGCAPVLGALCDRLNIEGGRGRFVWLPRPSKASASALIAGEAHVAGMHLTDARGGEANAAYLRSAARSRRFTLVTLARWEVGLVVARGNPRRIRRASDVADRRVRLINRERDASPRRVLERRLRAEGTRPPREIARTTSHRSVGHTIATGAADAGPSVRDTAIGFGLDFVPFQEERFELAVATEALELPEMRRFFDLLTSERGRAELGALGYDVRQTGDRTAVV